MKLNRRKFLILFASSATITVTLALAGPHWRGQATTQAQRFFSSLKTLEEAPTGELLPQTLKTLQAATEAILYDNLPNDLGHYEDLFTWRAQNLSGHKQLYEKFTATVDQEAKKSGQLDFASSSLSVRQNILNQVAPTISTSSTLSRLSTLRTALLSRDKLLFSEHIVHEIFRLFARTDAMLLVGYEAWPGQRRGLEAYRKAQQGKAAQVGS